MAETRNEDPRAGMKPPFARQQLEHPGHEGEMGPTPGWGERSYVGHGRLAGRAALVTCADSAATKPGLAPPFVFLACDESRYVTGEILGVTGGKPLA